MRAPDDEVASARRDPSAHDRRQAPRRIAGPALAALALAAGLYCLPSPLFWGDALAIVERVHRGALSWVHPGTLVLGWVVTRITGCAPEVALHALTSAAAAILALSSYVLIRRLGCGESDGYLGAFLVVGAPAVLFFAGHVELRAVHAAAVAVALLCVTQGGLAWSSLVVRAVVLAAVPFTHATGLLALPILSWLGWRALGGSWRYWFAYTSAATLAIYGVLQWAGSVNFGVEPTWGVHRPSDQPTVAIAHGQRFFEGFRLRSFVQYPRDAFLVPAGALAVVGVLGLVTLCKRRRRWGLPATVGVAAYLAAFSLWGWVEKGGYLLAVYPLLAIGAGEVFRGIREARIRRRWTGVIRAGALAIAPCVQGYLGIRTGLANAAEPSPGEWLESLRRVTGDEGSLVTFQALHESLARRRTRLRTVNGLLVLFEDRPSWPAGLDALRDGIRREVGRGGTVVVDTEIAWEARDVAELPAFFDRLVREDRATRIAVGSLRAIGWVNP